MRNGTYKVCFETPLGEGAGVLVINGDEIRGGDSTMYYTGNQAQNGDDITAEVVADIHTKVPDMASVFGVDRVHITLTGKVNGDSAQLTGKAKEAANVPFKATLTRIGD